MKTIIVGNGIIALTTAFRLAKTANSADEIVIIGKKSRPGSATLAAAAMFNSFAEIEEGSLEKEFDRYRFEMSRLATKMWPDFISDILECASSNLPTECLKCDGTYVVNNTAADNLDSTNFDAILAGLREFDEPFEEVSPAGIPNYFPEERYRATRAIYIPNEGWINPRLLIEVFESGLESFQKVSFVDSEADILCKNGNRIDTVVLKNGNKIEGDQFFIATGATASDLVDRSNIGIQMQRIFYGVGVSLQLTSPEFPHTQCIRTPNRGLACGLYTVPLFKGPNSPNDSIVIGASNMISPTPQTEGRVVSVQSLLQGAMEQINRNFYKATLERVNVGWRPTSTDTYMLAGATSLPNLFIATGTKRDGIHLAPLISQTMCSIMKNEKIDERFEVFRPERKVMRNLSRSEAVKKGTKHLISAAYQHGFIPAHGRMIHQMEQLYRDDLERLHDQVGAEEWGIPPEMIDMYRHQNIRPEGNDKL